MACLYVLEQFLYKQEALFYHLQLGCSSHVLTLLDVCVTGGNATLYAPLLKISLLTGGVRHC